MKTIEKNIDHKNNLFYASTETRIHFRWMLHRDLIEVLRIEAECFQCQWTEYDFSQCLQRRNCIGLVAEVNGQIQGFMVYELSKRGINLLNLAVSRHFRRQEIGRKLIQKLIGKLKNNRRNRISAAIQESNLDAQLFLKNLGFRAISIWRHFYKESSDDAYLMQYRLHKDFQVPSKIKILDIR